MQRSVHCCIDTFKFYLPGYFNEITLNYILMN